MTITVPINAIALTPGSTAIVYNLSWQDFEEILADLGDSRQTRLSYYRGTLEIVSPLAIHKRPHRIIGHIITTILEVQGRNWEDFGSTTLKRPTIAGIEPNTCFYIQNADLVRGCTDLDLDNYPPPDLAIESDVTSITTISAYEAMRVPEIWVYRNQTLKLYILQNGSYLEVFSSPTFPNLPIITTIPQLVQQAIEEGTSRMLRELRMQLQS